HLGDAQRLGQALQRATPAVPETDELMAVHADTLTHHRADDRVEAGAIASSGEHTDPHLEQSLRWGGYLRLASGDGAVQFAASRPARIPRRRACTRPVRTGTTQARPGYGYLLARLRARC